MNPKRKYEKTALVRNQAEIIARYNAVEKTRPVEANELTRIMSFHTAKLLGCTGDVIEQSDWAKEYNEEIEFSAQALLRLWETKLATGSNNDAERYLQMYTGFKWILGHNDCDTLPRGGEMGNLSFQYIKKQIITGEWAKLSAAAVAAKRAE